MPPAKDRTDQSRGHWIGKAAITETSTLALMMALALQATPALAQYGAQGAPQGAPVFATDAAPAIAPSPPLFASNPWEGFYAGGNVGYLFSGSSSYASDPTSVPSIGQTSVVGEEHIDYAHQLGPLSAGFQAGYNYVTASGLLLGVEADFSFPAILRSNLQQNIAALGPSVVNDNVQIFGSLVLLSHEI